MYPKPKTILLNIEYSEDTAITSGNITISYKAIFQDIREAIDFQYKTVI